MKLKINMVYLYTCCLIKKGSYKRKLVEMERIRKPEWMRKEIL